jgi:hypothetical protein
MSRKSAASNLVRRAPGDIPPATPGHLAQLLTAMDGPVDTSEISETRGHATRIHRNASGRLPRPRPSPIRQAILEALKRRGTTRYQLWKEARTHCPTLNQSAVYEYLRGQRDIGVPYVEALLKAGGLVVRPHSPVPPRKPRKAVSGNRRATQATVV